MTIPKTMKAAILVEQRKPLVADEVELPDSLDVGQVLVKIHYSGICGSQLGEIDGVKGEDRFLPHLLGHEASATVMEVGPGVRTVRSGDAVVLHWRKGQGIESAPPKYRWRGRTVNAGWLTTFNEYAIVSEDRMTPIPDDTDLDVAALFGCAVTTGFGVIENNAQVRIGESVVVYGAGGIGLNIVQAASLVSAYPIVAIDRYDNKLELASKMGATHTINSSNVNSKEEIMGVVGEYGVDCFIDNTGNIDVIEMGYDIVNVKHGRVTLVGVPKRGEKISINTLPLHFGKNISGSYGGNGDPATDILRYHNLYRTGKISLGDVITNTYGINLINDAISGMRNGEISGRCVVKM